MLNDHQIKNYAERNELISPFTVDQLQPHSYDCRLGDKILEPRCTRIDQSGMEPPVYTKVWEEKPTDEVQMYKCDFMLGTTQEYFKLPNNIVGFVHGKSTIGRNGLQIECAGLIDAGFEGQITLELFSMMPWPIQLKTGMPICQITFFLENDPRLKDYRKIGHYNGQRGPTKPRYIL